MKCSIFSKETHSYFFALCVTEFLKKIAFPRVVFLKCQEHLMKLLHKIIHKITVLRESIIKQLNPNTVVSIQFLSNTANTTNTAHTPI